MLTLMGHMNDRLHLPAGLELPGFHRHPECAGPAELAVMSALATELVRAAGVLVRELPGSALAGTPSDGWLGVKVSLHVPISDRIRRLMALYSEVGDSIPGNSGDVFPDKWTQALDDFDWALRLELAKEVAPILVRAGSVAVVTPLPEDQGIKVRHLGEDVETSMRSFIADPEEWERQMARTRPHLPRQWSDSDD